MAAGKKQSSAKRPARHAVTLDRVKILRHFGKVSSEPVPPELVARLLDVHQGDPDRDLRPMDTGLMILSGVASTLDTLAAQTLNGKDGGTAEERQGETLWFLAKEIHRAKAFIMADQPAPNSKASAYQIIRPRE